MSRMFYSDEIICHYEKKGQWEKSIHHLEAIFHENQNIQVLCSLIGFAWYYSVSPIIFEDELEVDYNYLIQVWKRYVDLGDTIASNNPYFNFVAGYTLSLHGFYIDQNYERKGLQYMKKCADSEHELLSEMAKIFLLNAKSKRYIPVKNKDIVCKQLFNGCSLIDEYFREIYT